MKINDYLFICSQKKQSLCSDDHVYAWNWNDYFFGDQSKLNISLPMGRSISYMGDCKRFSSSSFGIGTTGNSSIGKRCMSLAILRESSLSVFFND